MYHIDTPVQATERLTLRAPQGGDHAIGMAGPWFPAGWPEREIGWSMFDVETEGKGLAAEAARAVRRHVYTTLNWPTAVSYSAAANARSIALATRLGASLESTATAPGRDGRLVFRHPGPGAC